ncbi:hypothetical protein [Methylobacterium flocculans]|nr:hypothetical protein [Methylobacterium sp. FF17]
MNDQRIGSTNLPDKLVLISIVLNNIPAARRIAEAHRVGVRRDTSKRAAS